MQSCIKKSSPEINNSETPEQLHWAMSFWCFASLSADLLISAELC